MIDIESKIISYREDTNDYRLCLTREEIEEIKNIRTEVIAEISREIRLLYGNEYEQQIRAEVVNECIDILHNHYEVRNAEQNAFMDMLVMEFLRLKEQNK